MIQVEKYRVTVNDYKVTYFSRRLKEEFFSFEVLNGPYPKSSIIQIEVLETEHGEISNLVMKIDHELAKLN